MSQSDYVTLASCSLVLQTWTGTLWTRPHPSPLPRGHSLSPRAGSWGTDSVAGRVSTTSGNHSSELGGVRCWSLSTEKGRGGHFHLGEQTRPCPWIAHPPLACARVTGDSKTVHHSFLNHCHLFEVTVFFPILKVTCVCHRRYTACAAVGFQNQKVTPLSAGQCRCSSA